MREDQKTCKILLLRLDYTFLNMKYLYLVFVFLFTENSSKLSVRDVLTREFERMVTTELTPRWYSLGAKSRRLVADLRALRRLLFLLVKTDAVDFYRCWRLVISFFFLFFSLSSFFIFIFSLVIPFFLFFSLSSFFFFFFFFLKKNSKKEVFIYSHNNKRQTFF